MIGLPKLFQRDTGLGEAERRHLADELRRKELPEANAQVQEKVDSVLRIRGGVDMSSRALLNGETEEPEDYNAAFLQRLAAIEQAVSGVSAHIVSDPAEVQDPVSVTQQLSYLADELGVLQANLSLIGGAIGGYRKRISTLIQQVDIAEKSLSSKEQARHALKNGRAASNAVLREREKKITALDGQIGNVSSKLQRKRRQLRELDGARLPDITLEESNGSPAATVGSILEEIEVRLSRLNPSLAPVGDPETRFPDAVQRAKKNVAPSAPQAKVQEIKPDSVALQESVRKTNDALDESIAPVVLLFRQALTETAESVVAELNGRTLRSSEFLAALNRCYNKLLKERGLGSIKARYANSTVFVDALPEDFTSAMDCLEVLKEEWERKKAAAEADIAKIEHKFQEQWQSASHGNIRTIPQIRRRHTRRGMETSYSLPRSPLFNSRYKNHQADREEARLKLEYITSAQSGANWGSPIQAVIRWFKRKANEKAAQTEGKQRKGNSKK